ncbi:hypothetical protein Nepgr_010716 [Nepenthes gracilis]|uniref:Importin subunit beta-1/Transportin-1-like TPR repeats domain-containing protein n=1 Tax=Nepenthes gracilis TaxID=150966 RepID=A0AAD3SDR6_NEPGR|nr:hypothetical protein Nepgr_010716 [Nepenthes gracilis]
MMELHQTLEAQKLSSDEGEKRYELQGLLCGCLKNAAESSAQTSAAGGRWQEYNNLLRNGISEAYFRILHGFKNSPKTKLLIPYAYSILQFLDSIYQERDKSVLWNLFVSYVLSDLILMLEMF